MPFDARKDEPTLPAIVELSAGGITRRAAFPFHQSRGSAARLAALALAAILGLAASLAAEPATPADADLQRLMQAMAALKGVIAVALIAAMGWRLSMPASPARLALYLAAAAAITGGVGLMWRASHLAETALLMHAGLFGAIVLLLRDRTMIAKLEQEIARRVLARDASAAMGPDANPKSSRQRA